jgi:hypothetical protein
MRLHRLRGQLLNDMELMQAAMPADSDDISEAVERHARILSLMARALEVMSRLSQKKDTNPVGEPQDREAILADIEHRLARLGQVENPPPAAGKLKR